MDGHLDGLEDFFARYKEKLAESQNTFQSFRATEKRRRAMMKKNRQQISDLTSRLVIEISTLLNKPMASSDSQEKELFNNLRDVTLPSPQFQLCSKLLWQN